MICCRSLSKTSQLAEHLLCFCLLLWVLNSLHCLWQLIAVFSSFLSLSLSFFFHSCGAAACRVPAASFHPHLNRSHWLDPCDWQAWLAWGCEMLVSMLFTLPDSPPWAHRCFQKSCKHLLCALMSADSISNHKDSSCLPVRVYSFMQGGRVFPASKPFRWSEGLNQNHQTDLATSTIESWSRYFC